MSLTPFIITQITCGISMAPHFSVAPRCATCQSHIVEEIFSAIMREGVDQAEIVVVTCRVAYTQIMAAIDSRFRKEDITTEDYKLKVTSFPGCDRASCGRFPAPARPLPCCRRFCQGSPLSSPGQPLSYAAFLPRRTLRS